MLRYALRKVTEIRTHNAAAIHQLAAELDARGRLSEVEIAALVRRQPPRHCW